MAKKLDKAVKELAKEVKKLRKENEKLAQTLGKTREDQAESNRKVLALLDERLPVGGTGADDAEDHLHDENGGFVTAETASEGGDEEALEASSADTQQDQQEEPEVTEAAKRRAEELGVDPTGVKGTGSGGRVLVKDVEAASGE